MRWLGRRVVVDDDGTDGCAAIHVRRVVGGHRDSMRAVADARGVQGVREAAEGPAGGNVAVVAWTLEVIEDGVIDDELRPRHAGVVARVVDDPRRPTYPPTLGKLTTDHGHGRRGRIVKSHVDLVHQVVGAREWPDARGERPATGEVAA